MALGFLALLLPVFAFAHVSFDRAEPKVGATVGRSPTEVKVWFSDDVDASLCDVEVSDAAGKRVDKQDAHVDATDKSLLVVSVADLPPGSYKVTWRAACVDKHKVKGSFRFEVK